MKLVTRRAGAPRLSAKLKVAIDVAIYFSVLLGALLSVQVNGQLPLPVFSAILLGWAAYVLAAFLALKNNKAAHPIALILSVLTLLASLPQQAHYTFIQRGELLPAATFVVGSAIQLCILVLVPLRVLAARRAGRQTPESS